MNWIRRIFIVSAVFVVGGMASLINVHAETYGDYEYEMLMGKRSPSPSI